MSHAMTAIVPCLFRHKSVALRDFLCASLPLNYRFCLCSTRHRESFFLSTTTVCTWGGCEADVEDEKFYGIDSMPHIKIWLHQIEHGPPPAPPHKLHPPARPDSRQEFIHCITDSLPSEDNRNGLCTGGETRGLTCQVEYIYSDYEAQSNNRRQRVLVAALHDGRFRPRTVSCVASEWGGRRGWRSMRPRIHVGIEFSQIHSFTFGER